MRTGAKLKMFLCLSAISIVDFALDNEVCGMMGMPPAAHPEAAGDGMPGSVVVPVVLRPASAVVEEYRRGTLIRSVRDMSARLGNWREKSEGLLSPLVFELHSCGIAPSDRAITEMQRQRGGMVRLLAEHLNDRLTAQGVDLVTPADLLSRGGDFFVQNLSDDASIAYFNAYTSALKALAGSVLPLMSQRSRDLMDGFGFLPVFEVTVRAIGVLNSNLDCLACCVKGEKIVELCGLLLDLTIFCAGRNYAPQSVVIMGINRIAGDVKRELLRPGQEHIAIDLPSAIDGANALHQQVESEPEAEVPALRVTNWGDFRAAVKKIECGTSKQSVIGFLGSAEVLIDKTVITVQNMLNKFAVARPQKEAILEILECAETLE
jgi:hypothetical protein